MITEYREERQTSLILDYFSRDARIRLLRRAETFGAPVFVVDFDRGSRHFRTLGSFGAGAQVTEQSSMDLLYPCEPAIDIALQDARGTRHPRRGT